MEENIKLEGLDLELLIFTHNFDPSNLTLKFLTEKDIVPDNWTNGKQIICSNEVSQILFPEKLNFFADDSRIGFIENINYFGEDISKSAKLPQISMTMTDELHRLFNIKYFSANLTLKGYITFKDNPSYPHEYIFQKILRPPIDDWKDNVENALVKGSLNLSYLLQGREFTFGIDEAQLSLSGGRKIPIILFTGTFKYLLRNDSSNEKGLKNCPVASNWLKDLDVYLNIVKKLSDEVEV